MPDDELLFAGMHDKIRRAYFLPDWLSDEEIDILFTHYVGDIDNKNHRYRVKPYMEPHLFCIVDDHTDQLFHTQRGSVRTRRVWTSRNVSEAINYAELLSTNVEPVAKEETHISQVVRYINPRRKVNTAEPVKSAFKLCQKCQQMVRGTHEC